MHYMYLDLDLFSSAKARLQNMYHEWCKGDFACEFSKCGLWTEPPYLYTTSTFKKEGEERKNTVPSKSWFLLYIERKENLSVPKILH